MNDFRINIPNNLGKYWKEHATEVAEQVLIDQSRWLDETMAKILTKAEYKLMKDDSVSDEAKAMILRKRGILLQHIPDVCGLRILLHDKPFAQFTANFTYDDGQKIYSLIPQAEEADKDAAVPSRQSFIVDNGQGMN